MNLPIIQSIIHGELRPNIVEKYNFRDVSNAMNVLPEKLSDVERLFISKFPEIEFDFESDHPFPFNCGVTEVYTPLNEGSLSKHFELPIPKWTTPKEKFYQIIVDAEIHRIKLAIVDYALKDRSDISTRTTVKDTLRQIVKYSKKVDASVSAIFAALRIKLICAYVEIAAIASPILAVNKDFLSFEDLMFEVLKRYPNDEELNLYNKFCNPIIQAETQVSVEKQIVESSPEIQLLKSKYNTFMEVVQLYNFFELPKLKELSLEKKNELIMNLVKSVPYAIAMLEYLEYPKYLKDNYIGMHTKEAIYKHIAKALGVKPDTIKGQFLAYRNSNIGKAVKYTSYQFKENVQNDYENLLCK